MHASKYEIVLNSAPKQTLRKAKRIFASCLLPQQEESKIFAKTCAIVAVLHDALGEFLAQLASRSLDNGWRL